MTFSEWVRLSGVKRIEIARRLGISPGHVTDLCNQRFWPTREMAQRIYKLTSGEVTPTDFLFDDEPPPDVLGK